MVSKRLVILSESYNYNDQGRIVSTTNAKGETNSFTYYTDTNNNFVVEATQSLDNGKTAKTESIYGSETSYAYPKEVIKYYTDDKGNNVQTKESDTYNMLLGLISKQEVYDSANNKTNATNYTYDLDGRVIMVQSPDYSNIYGKTYEVKTDYTYKDGYYEDYNIGDSYSGIYGTTVNTTTTYLNKDTNISYYYNKSENIYDAYGNLRQEKLYDGSNAIKKSQYKYDNLQRVTSVTDADNNTVYQSYDGWGQANEVTDASGNLYVNNYDVKNSRTLSYFVAIDNLTSYRANTSSNTYKEDYVETNYDQFGRTISRKAYPNWPNTAGELSELYSYDIAGNVVAYTDPKRNLNEDGFTTTYMYDVLNRVNKVKDGENHITDVNYDVLGNITSVSMKDNATSTNSVSLYTKTYNEVGELLSKSNPGSTLPPTQYSYNSLGLNTKVVDRNASTLSCSYDGFNQLFETNQVSSTGTKDNPQPKLLEKILFKDNLNRAFKRVKANKGAPGINDITVDEVSAYLRENQRAIIEGIYMGKYKPHLVRRKEIPMQTVECERLIFQQSKTVFFSKSLHNN